MWEPCASKIRNPWCLVMPTHGNARDVAHDVSHDPLQMLIKTSRWPNSDAGHAAPSRTAPLRIRPRAQADQESELARGFDHVVNIPACFLIFFSFF